ncbi:hypothetical protein G6F57_007987 [Rhizopus arrhizus]|uniref:Uncharacterized protein n=1 Tax=Rhizopus oryzae TaxID=64495 RepID=A0A9P6X2R2_RHIOR|nr:hypothetical protein G6F23_007694 [Rhizopus arrhizus]KAG1412979.1 hypothetical protein G6F58_007728 [Rhizopus delemar]KAG0761235.1 hypothetical protein G6F24_007720 [Rhizopus arrhizus]KAG0784883.1 hypothetical protein G6F21_009624 [Rhizopus arrhizus]KAG0793255.1 hypothetical protein G6F22_005649 [Rhizopus arrhizus]
MQPSSTLRAVHKPLIRFLGPRASLWKDTPHHTGPHPLTPSNLVKHVAQAEAQQPVRKATGSIEFGALPTKYQRSLISEAEMEAIESGGATIIF